LKAVYILGGAIAVFVWLAVGLFIARGPQPEIVVAAEIITKVGFLNISNTMITAWTVMALLIIISLLATRSMKLMPGGLQNFAEAVIGFLMGQCEEIAGEKNGRKFFMVIATFFLFIIFSNWFGLLPFFNAIGKTEDVGHHVFHEIETHHEEGKPFESDKFAAVKMKKSGGVALIQNGAKLEDFPVDEGEDATITIDRYIVWLAEKFTDFEVQTHEGEAHDEFALPSADTVKAAKAALDADDKAPLLLLKQGEADGEHTHEPGVEHGVPSQGLGQTVVGIDFRGDKLGLVVPYFRGVYSDVNNTLALGIIAFIMIELWGFQALGLSYLGKFFTVKGVIPAFVGFLELLSELIRVVSFAFRLFGNIFAGEVLVLMLTFLMPFLFVDIIYGLELFVGFIQASVFSLLVLVFGSMATEHHGEEEHHEDHSGEDGTADVHHHSGAAQAH
jgi:F0F1-type ATP synthase membrane subunit a